MASFDRRATDRLLTHLLELPPANRPATLAEACGDDRALRTAVERLLRAAESPEGFFFEPGSAWSDALWREWARDTEHGNSPLPAGSLVGPYRILEEIGRGGMAVVYRAERADGEFNRQVAVKLLKRGLTAEEIVRDFEQERRILAGLDHPNIAHLLDAGRTADGQPYFVMEYVEGRPVTRYCDENGLSVEARLKLFLTVAAAVEYAHRNLVVHRDLKPSNILVNDAGEIKLLDFGIARLLDVDTGNDPATPVTRPFLRVMTPEYASPEQIRGERVTTSSDVYQLGLLLYELLTGQRPQGGSETNPSELVRMICEQAPARPSTVVTRPAPAAEALCRARGTSPPRLRRRLRGDLENIVLKALQKLPQARYGSADRMARDIRRHLNGRPVTAREGTWLYRGGKFLQRHALGAGATVLLLAIAAATVVFHTSRIQDERDRARVAAAKSEQMSRFLIDMFLIDQFGGAGDTMGGAERTARELLELGVERITRKKDFEPGVRADILQVLGRVHMELGLYRQAEALLTRALMLRRERSDSEVPDIARLAGQLGVLRYRQGHFRRARERLDTAVTMLERAQGPEAAGLVDMLLILGPACWRLGERELGLAHLERALAIQTHLSGEDSARAASIMQNMGALLIETGALERARNLLERALDIYRQTLGPAHPQTGLARMNIANILLEQRHLDEAESMYRSSLEILEQAYESDHYWIGMAQYNLGHLLNLTGRHAEAVPLLRDALAIYTATVGPIHPDMAYPLVGLGDAHSGARRFDAARDAYRRSLELLDDTIPTDTFSPLMFRGLVGLGRAEIELGETTSGERAMERALEIWKHLEAGTDSSLLPGPLHALGSWLAAGNRCGEAVSLLTRALELEAVHAVRSQTMRTGLESLLADCGAGD